MQAHIDRVLTKTGSSPLVLKSTSYSFAPFRVKAKKQTNKLSLGLLKIECISNAKTGSSTMKDSSLEFFRREVACACIGYVFSLVVHTIFHAYFLCLVTIFAGIVTEEEEEENDDR